MNDNTQKLNRQIAISMAKCSLVVVYLMICKVLHIFEFDKTLSTVIIVVGLIALLSPLVLFFLKVPDKFLKYYMSIAMAVLIGALGCFNGIGIYITFVLVPIASCLYFDIRFTKFCSIFSYVVMAVAVYFNSSGRYEPRFLGWTHLETFRAYMIGFSLEYFVIIIFLAQILKRANGMVDEQHHAYIDLMAKDAKYRLLMKESKDIIFEYYPNEDRYEANRPVYPGMTDSEERIVRENMNKHIEKFPKLKELYDHIKESFNNDQFEDFEMDMSYEVQGKNVPLWYQVECFVVRDGDEPISIIGKMHDITHVKLAQAGIRRQKVESIYHDKKRENSLYEQMMIASEHFTESDYGFLAEGHRFLAQVIEDIKYSEDFITAIDTMLAQVGEFFHVDRICVVETDMSTGNCCVNYQWTRREEDRLRDYFTSMSLEDVKKTIDTYDQCGYIEVNPSKGIMTSPNGDTELIQNVVFKVILGNQIWIPMMSNGKYIGAVCFDRVDTTSYTAVEKFLMAESVNTLSSCILKINAENSNRAKSDFLSTMSHEIRTPMNAIVGMTEVALREDMPEEVKKSLRTVKSSAFGLLTLINDILDYSKIEAGKFDIVKEDFSLMSVLNDVQEIVKARNNGKLELEFIVPDRVPAKVNGDGIRIKQVMLNYCSNAIKYSEKGKVIISTKLEKEDEKTVMLHFSVKDQGIGIREEDLPKLFKSYARVDTTVNHHTEGTGLGLAISGQLVELMNGTVGVESEYGKGSTFVFSLPLGIEDWDTAGNGDDIAGEDRGEEKEKDSSDVIAPNARVLIVDDNSLNLMVAEALMEPTQMQIDTAESGEQALEMIKEKDYDLIFMDHFMPGMDGVETMLHIRAMEDEPKKTVPIVALTADAMEGVKEEMISKGMDDFLTKPIIMKDLNRILRRWLPEDLLSE